MEAKTNCDSNLDDQLPVFMRATINEIKERSSNGEDTMQELFGSDGEGRESNFGGTSLRMEEDSFCRPRK